CTRGRGVGGEGVFAAESKPPHPNPSPPSTGARGFPDRLLQGELTMLLHSWLRNLRSALAPRRGQRHHVRRGSLRAATHRPSFEPLEERCVPALYDVTEPGALGGS